ncbi:MAG: glutaminyl-peptide cyclotransferase [bacterium]|nr:glutaminyl-peptide cyclotransferase [bacterium]
MVRLALILLLVAATTSCAYFETDEAHPAPQTPLLPPTSESLSAPVDLTPATAPEPSVTGAAPADSTGTAPEGGSAEPVTGDSEDGDEAATGDSEAGDGDGESADEPQLLQIVVVGELLHSPTAFTQGLEISDGRLYESTGARADRASTLRELHRDTGDVLRLHEITEDVFAEGITFVDDRIYQLTWKDEVAFVWDPEPEEFAELERFEYEGQGWGLCYNGHVLVMSDGSAELHFRDPVTFERAGNPVLVTLEGEELPSLNELECVGEYVWANVWQTDLIVRIDPVTGRVLAIADASDLGQPRPDDPNAVLNGIAWDPDTETFLVTGKDWPAMYEIYFEAAGDPNEDPRRLDP